MADIHCDVVMSPAGGASCLVINYCTDISCTFTFYLLLGSFGSFRGGKHGYDLPVHLYI